MENWDGKKIVSIMGKAVLLTYVLTALLLLFLAFLSLQLQMSAGQIGIGILCIYGAACLAGGWYGAGESRKKKAFLGACRGRALFCRSSSGFPVGRENAQRGLGAAFFRLPSVRRFRHGRRHRGGMERIEAKRDFSFLNLYVILNYRVY